MTKTTNAQMYDQLTQMRSAFGHLSQVSELPASAVAVIKEAIERVGGADVVKRDLPELVELVDSIMNS